MNINIRGQNYSIDAANKCPHCHVTQRPNHVGTYPFDNDTRCYLMWSCVNDQCKKSFIGFYERDGSSFHLNGFIDGTPELPDWPQVIVDLNASEVGEDGNPIPSKFIEIYKQSCKAESIGLSEIAGMGFRKSLEFLVKDYAIANNAQDKDKIKKTALSKVIEDYFDEDVKEIAKRTAWLGNDESHYVRKHMEYELGDIKKLIMFLITDLDREYQKQQYIKNIQPKK